MILCRKNESVAARRRMYFHCVDATDGMEPETGEAGGQPQKSVNGAAWEDTSGTLVAIGNGRYYVELTQGEVNIDGVIEGRYRSANTAESVGSTIQVVPWDPYDVVGLGLTNLDAAISSRSTATALASHDDALTAHNDALTTHDNALASHAAELTTHDNALTAHNNALTSHNSALASHNTALTAHDSALTTHDADIKARTKPTADYFDPSIDEVITDNASRIASRATGFATEVKQDIISGVVDDINAKTMNLPPDPADDSDIDAQLAAISASITDLYHADIYLTVDETNSKDEYTATWYKNGVRITSGVTNPKIQVVKRLDGTDLVAETAMTEIGSSGSYKYDEGVSRLTAGEAALAIVTATIDGSERSFAAIVGRDSSA